VPVPSKVLKHNTNLTLYLWSPTVDGRVRGKISYAVSCFLRVEALQSWMSDMGIWKAGPGLFEEVRLIFILLIQPKELCYRHYSTCNIGENMVLFEYGKFKYTIPPRCSPSRLSGIP
jgi:hypothetical protein